MSTPLLLARDGDEKPLGWIIFCPACRMGHMFYVDQPNPRNGARWTFDGNQASPTFSPSMLARYHSGPQQKLVICHSFVRAGRIEFLGDCTHELRGQTVDLPDWDEIRGNE